MLWKKFFKMLMKKSRHLYKRLTLCTFQKKKKKFTFFSLSPCDDFTSFGTFHTGSEKFFSGRSMSLLRVRDKWFQPLLNRIWTRFNEFVSETRNPEARPF